MSTTERVFDPNAFKETTRQQWNDAAEAWNRWSPLLSRWLGPATERMLDMTNVEAGSRVLDVAAGAGEQTAEGGRLDANVGEALARAAPSSNDAQYDAFRAGQVPRPRTHVHDGHGHRCGPRCNQGARPIGCERGRSARASCAQFERRAIRCVPRGTSPAPTFACLRRPLPAYATTCRVGWGSTLGAGALSRAASARRTSWRSSSVWPTKRSRKLFQEGTASLACSAPKRTRAGR